MGLTMQEFAAKVGVGQSMLSRYEAGKAVPGGQVIFALMKLANAEEKARMEQCLSGEDVETPDPFASDKWVIKSVFQPGETFISQKRRVRAHQEQLNQLKTLADRVLPNCDPIAIDLLMSMLRFIEQRPVLGRIAAGAPVESFPTGPEESMDQRPKPSIKRAKH